MGFFFKSTALVGVVIDADGNVCVCKWFVRRGRLVLRMWIADCWLCNCLFSFLQSCKMQTKETVTLCQSFVHYYGIFTLIFCFERIREKCLIA